MRRTVGMCVLLLFLACQKSTAKNPQNFSPTSRVSVVAEEAFPQLHFTQPVDLQDPKDGTNRLFVLEQAGRIWVFPNRKDVSQKTLFLDIHRKVRQHHAEEGLLGLAFHPRFAQTGYFFVNYTASGPRRTVIARYQVDPQNPNRADPKSEVVLLTIRQPWGNHNGGCLAFGPDGYLYIATGDGGAGGDPKNAGQRLDTLLGKILRIDVDRQERGRPYAIPKDNPFVGRTGARPEIWAYGLRNPWRMSFDRETGRLWAADVGQNRIEEVNIIRKGGNYGWRLKEGSQPFRPKGNMSGLIDPVWEYSHTWGKSITGGYVCRDKSLPDLYGAYLCADFYSGRLWALWIDRREKLRKVEQVLHNRKLFVSSFGEDAQGRLYLVSYFSGKIYVLTSSKRRR